jgi:hypothetical protein
MCGGVRVNPHIWTCHCGHRIEQTGDLTAHEADVARHCREHETGEVVQ